jgi:hypothetical protein
MSVGVALVAGVDSSTQANKVFVSGTQGRGP